MDRKKDDQTKNTGRRVKRKRERVHTAGVEWVWNAQDRPNVNVVPQST